MQQTMNEIGGPDPKSQKAIDRLPESQRKRYNEATQREFEGMKKKDVMDICIVNWVTKYVRARLKDRIENKVN
jgi:hypothetical protein